MKHKILCNAFLLCIATLTAACASKPSIDEGLNYKNEAKRYYFEAKSQVSSMAAIQAQLIDDVGIQTENFKHLPGFSSEVTPEQLAKIKAMQPDLEVHQVPMAQTQPDRPFVVPCEDLKEPEKNELPWGLKRMKVEDAWKVTKGQGVMVAVIDTGIDLNHEAFKRPDGTSRVKICKSAFGSTCQDDNGHGTHVAGTIAADKVRGKNSVGIAPHADLAIYKGLGANGQGTFDVLTDLIIQAGIDGADVINNSWGGPQPFAPLEAAIKALKAKGVMVVSASGNNNGAIIYPGRYSTPVGAINESDQKASFSNFGPEMITNNGVVAPGTNIFSTCVGNTYCTKQGTSMAAPHVAGAEALRIAAKRIANLCAEKLKGLVDEVQGLGFLDLEKCVGN